MGGTGSAIGDDGAERGSGGVGREAQGMMAQPGSDLSHPGRWLALLRVLRVLRVLMVLTVLRVQSKLLSRLLGPCDSATVLGCAVDRTRHTITAATCCRDAATLQGGDVLSTAWGTKRQQTLGGGRPRRHPTSRPLDPSQWSIPSIPSIQHVLRYSQEGCRRDVWNGKLRPA